ncbi:MAG: ABC transporter permease subunit [Chloroflexota bacterium]
MPRFARTFLLVVAIIIVFAYGFQVTEISLEEPKQPRRQEQLTNVLRALARPDLVSYETERIEAEATIFVPCQAGQTATPANDQGGASLILSADCAEPGSEITISGSGFEASDRVFLFFIPYKEDPSEAPELPLLREVVQPERDGAFSQVVELRDDRVSDQPQRIRAVVNRRVGAPHPSEAVNETITKIIETIFLALIATTLGTFLSIPTSFLAARNLMINVTSVFSSLMAIIIAAPIGWLLGSQLFGFSGRFGVGLFTANSNPAEASLLFLGAPAIIFMSVQALGSSGLDTDSFGKRLQRLGLGLIVALVMFLILGLIAGLGQLLSLTLDPTLGAFSFLSNFLFVISDALATFLPFIGGMVGLFMAISAANLIANQVLRPITDHVLKQRITLVLAFLAGAIVLAVPAMFLTWLYELTNPLINIGVPAIIGGVGMTLLAWRTDADYPVATGTFVYYAVRTILNVLRAIEPLIMAIVFVVWVGIGPFAGVLALTLHTIAALGKLYSEQVENISQGPIEALTATGANRLQTIIYAVIPQIVPPYIAFTIYRWDINVRMSTIIGFAGGGGIGFLLQQNLNLLKYRQASVQMIAIAIVVASLDYVSAKIRERIT